ncbi:MAG: NUDIX hydrolase [Paracoccaceae bacterium]
MSKEKQQPIKLPAAGKREIRTQFGALCYRVRNDRIQVLVITTRSRKNWIVPKGWPVDRATPSQSAAREAFEEAGVEGKVSSKCLGIFSYQKELDGDDLPCVVALFPLKVKRIHAIYPEKGLRKRKWLNRKKAAALVENPELSQMIKDFSPKSKLRKPAKSAKKKA